MARLVDGVRSMDEPTETSPLQQAQARLGGLAAAGASPARATAAVGELIAGWASEMDMAGSTAQARVALLWDGFTRDASDLEEQISDAGGADLQALGQARRQLEALQAIVAALQAAHERLPGAD